MQLPTQDQIMLTTAARPRARTKRETAVEIGVVALSALVAVGVSVLFLALIGAARGPSAQQFRIHTTPARAAHVAAVATA